MAEQACRILHEGEAVQDAYDAGAEVALAAVGIEQLPELGRRQCDGHGVDREVAPQQVLADRRMLDGRQRSRVLVVLGAGARHVNALVARDDDRRAERAMCMHPPSQPLGQRVGEPDPVALNRQVDVEGRLTQQQIADGAADKVDPFLLVACRPNRVPHVPQPRSGEETVAQVRRGAAPLVGPVGTEVRNRLRSQAPPAWPPM